MKRTAILVALTALLVAVFATAAFTLPGRVCSNDPCFGNENRNILYERRGDERSDTIHGRGGGDTLDAKNYVNDRDVLYGDTGSDWLATVDHDSRDYVSGGRGKHDLCDVNLIAVCNGIEPSLSRGSDGTVIVHHYAAQSRARPMVGGVGQLHRLPL